jgi:hypothetical protein
MREAQLRHLATPIFDISRPHSIGRLMQINLGPPARRDQIQWRMFGSGVTIQIALQVGHAEVNQKIDLGQLRKMADGLKGQAFEVKRTDKGEMQAIRIQSLGNRKRCLFRRTYVAYHSFRNRLRPGGCRGDKSAICIRQMNFGKWFTFRGLCRDQRTTVDYPARVFDLTASRTAKQIDVCRATAELFWAVGVGVLAPCRTRDVDVFPQTLVLLLRPFANLGNRQSIFRINIHGAAPVMEQI